MNKTGYFETKMLKGSLAVKKCTKKIIKLSEKNIFNIKSLLCLIWHKKVLIELIDINLKLYLSN